MRMLRSRIFKRPMKMATLKIGIWRQRFWEKTSVVIVKAIFLQLLTSWVKIFND